MNPLAIISLIEAALPALLQLAQAVETLFGGAVNPTNPATPVVTHLSAAVESLKATKAAA